MEICEEYMEENLSEEIIDSVLSDWYGDDPDKEIEEWDGMEF